VQAPVKYKNYQKYPQPMAGAQRFENAIGAAFSARLFFDAEVSPTIESFQM
jgi:hypothetical protein